MKYIKKYQISFKIFRYGIPPLFVTCHWIRNLEKFPIYIVTHVKLIETKRFFKYSEIL